MKLAFIVQGPPQPKERARRGKGGRWYTPTRTRQYEAAVRTVANLAVMAELRRDVSSPWPVDARYLVTVAAWFADGRRRDVDNVAKACLDACNGIVFRDDSQVAELRSVRGGIDRANPRTEVVVEVVDAKGAAA